MKAADLADFLRVQCAKGCKDFFLRQVVAEAGGWGAAQVGSYSCPDGELALDVATAMMKDAKDDAGDVAGAQTYAAVATLEGNEVARRRWVVSGGEKLIKDSGQATEPPTMAGVLAQMMRHNEAQARTVHLSVGGVLEAQQRMIETLSKQNEFFTSKHWELLESTERVLSSEHEKKLAFAHEEHQLQLKTRAFEHLEPLAKVVVSKLTGRKLAPHEEGDSALDQFLGTISLEEMGELERIFAGPRFVVIAELWEEAKKRVVANQEAKDKAEAAARAKREAATGGASSASSAEEASP